MDFKTLFYILYTLIIFTAVKIADAGNYSDIDLAESHLKYYFNSFPGVANECRKDPTCPYKVKKIFY